MLRVVMYLPKKVSGLGACWRAWAGVGSATWLNDIGCGLKNKLERR